MKLTKRTAAEIVGVALTVFIIDRIYVRYGVPLVEDWPFWTQPIPFLVLLIPFLVLVAGPCSKKVYDLVSDKLWKRRMQRRHEWEMQNITADDWETKMTADETVVVYPPANKYPAYCTGDDMYYSDYADAILRKTKG